MRTVTHLAPGVTAYYNRVQGLDGGDVHGDFAYATYRTAPGGADDDLRS